jgi:hypothetical protein
MNTSGYLRSADEQIEAARGLHETVRVTWTIASAQVAAIQALAAAVDRLAAAVEQSKVGLGGLEPPTSSLSGEFGHRVTKVREVNEGACEWMRPAGRALVVVTWCCQLDTADPAVVASIRCCTAW